MKLLKRFVEYGLIAISEYEINEEIKELCEQVAVIIKQSNVHSGGTNKMKVYEALSQEMDQFTGLELFLQSETDRENASLVARHDIMLDFIMGNQDRFIEFTNEFIEWQEAGINNNVIKEAKVFQGKILCLKNKQAKLNEGIKNFKRARNIEDEELEFDETVGDTLLDDVKRIVHDRDVYKRAFETMQKYINGYSKENNDGSIKLGLTFFATDELSDDDVDLEAFGLIVNAEEKEDETVLK